MRRMVHITALCLFALHLTASIAAAVPAKPGTPLELPQLVHREGTLPQSGRMVIRSGLAWLNEESPLFSPLLQEAEKSAAARGLSLVPAAPSRMADLPPGTDAVRNAVVPEAGGKGKRQRVMSVPEATARMQAMHLARTGKLPQTRFGSNAGILGLPQAPGGESTAKQTVPNTQSLRLTQPELIRFALSQEEGLPALSGHVDIPGRLPQELREKDPNLADYAMTAKFAMLWPAARQKADRAIVAGWHMLTLDCYDLAPARQGKEPRKVWSSTVQRVVRNPDLTATLPDMMRAALQ